MKQTILPGIGARRRLYALYAVAVAVAMPAMAAGTGRAPHRAAHSGPAGAANNAAYRRSLSGPEPSRGAFRRDAATGVPAGCLRSLLVVATAYAPIATVLEGGRFTKTGRDGQSAHGVAVDPRVIPLGSRLWIPGYGHAVADDTGGAIRGRRVDVRMQDVGNLGGWGRRTVRVYILGPAAG